VKGRVLLGVVTRVLNDPERARLQSNRGLVVTGVIDISPAYNFDVLVGDIMLTLDGLPLATPDSILSLLDAYKGKTVRVKLNRAGMPLEKDITIGS
jgi:S1-C subfamily serine protease